MQDIRRSSVTRFFVVPLTLLALFSGCAYKWTDLHPPFQLAVPEAEPGHARLTLTNLDSVELVSPIVEGDTLFGDLTFLEADRARYLNVTMVLRGDESVARAAIPFSEIVRVEAREVDAGKTALVAVFSVAGLVLAGLAVYSFVRVFQWASAAASDSP